MRCFTCKQLDAQISKWDIFKYNLMCRMFPQETRDLQAEAHTRGIGTGYAMGFKACKNHGVNMDKLAAEMSTEDSQEWLAKDGVELEVIKQAKQNDEMGNFIKTVTKYED